MFESLRDKFNFDNKPTVSIVVVQDAGGIIKSAKAVEKHLKSHDTAKLDVQTFEFGSDLRTHLKKNAQKPDKVPNTFIMDCGGAGQSLGVEIAEWFRDNRPDEPAPEIYFMSLDVSSSIYHAARLHILEPDIKTGYISDYELTNIQHYLDHGSENVFDTSATRQFREILNDKLGTTFPMTVHKDYAQRYENDFESAKQGSILEGWKAGRVTATDAINYWRTYSTNLVQTLKTGLISAQRDDVNTDADFYTGTGFPVKGVAVFDIERVKNWPEDRNDKPILVMQSYDPDVIPLIKEGKISGLVASGPYLAAHLAFVCSSNNVSGVFGLKPEKKEGIIPEFNELSQSHLAPYFEEPQADINGQTIHDGDEIMIRVGKNGLIFQEDTITDMQKRIAEDKQNQPDNLHVNSGNLKQLYECFWAYLKENGEKPHKIKANIDKKNTGYNENYADYASGIGLIRTEQLATQGTDQFPPLRKILLDEFEDDADRDASYAALLNEQDREYRSFFWGLRPETPVKIRLFDLSPRELFFYEDQTKFHEKYNSLDIHGGQALEQWPRLYATQTQAIFKALNSACYGDTPNHPLQIMMPAIRTEEDTLQAKKMISDAAEATKTPEDYYHFGVMIETLDSCHNAAAVIQHCDFISFGTNDLTQQVLDIPRDDLRARAAYEDKHGFDPYKKLAPEVMELIKSVCATAREIKPDIEIDLCGGQGADLSTAYALFDAGVDNISVAPTKENLLALPLEMYYQQFDKIAPKAQPQATHAAQKLS